MNRRLLLRSRHTKSDTSDWSETRRLSFRFVNWGSVDSNCYVNPNLLFVRIHRAILCPNFENWDQWVGLEHYLTLQMMNPAKGLDFIS